MGGLELLTRGLSGVNAQREQLGGLGQIHSSKNNLEIASYRLKLTKSVSNGLLDIKGASF